MRTRRAIRWLVYSLVGAAVIGSSAYLLGGGFLSWISVCRVCGARRQSTNVLWIFPVHRVQATALSHFVDEQKIWTEHRHQWLLGQGGGAGAKCALGPGRHLFGITDDVALLRFLSTLKQYRGMEEARVWLSAALDPERAREVRSCFSPEPEQVKDQRAFDEWFVEQKSVWEEYEPETKGHK